MKAGVAVKRVADPGPLSMPASQLAELMSRPDALPTIQRLAGAVDEGTPELHIELVAIAVLRARQAAEQIGRRA